jgi:hypothetical protein
MSFDDALTDLTTSVPKSQGGHGSEDFFHEYYHAGRNTMFGDVSVRFIPNGDYRDIWSKLLTIDDGGSVHILNTLRSDSFTYRKLKLGNCIRVAIFVLLFFLPLPWVWLNPTSGRGAL